MKQWQCGWLPSIRAASPASPLLPHSLPWSPTSESKCQHLIPCRRLFSRELGLLGLQHLLQRTLNKRIDGMALGLGEWRGDKDSATFTRVFLLIPPPRTRSHSLTPCCISEAGPPRLTPLVRKNPGSLILPRRGCNAGQGLGLSEQFPHL